MSQDENGAPKRLPPRALPRPAGSATRSVKPPAPPEKKPPPPPPSSADELDDADLLSDEHEAAAPSAVALASPFEHVEAVAPPDSSSFNPFLPADAQPLDPRLAEPAATASAKGPSPFVESDVDVPVAEPPPPENRASSIPPATPRRRSRALLFVLPVAVVACGAFAFRAKLAGDEPRRGASFSEMPGRSDEPATPPLPSSFVEPAPPPTHSVPPPEKSAAASSAKSAAGRAPAGAASIPSGQSGILDTTHLPAGRKIVVNGRVIGVSPRRVVVRCGTLRVQIGDLPTESIDLPCGGEVTFTDN